MKLNTLTLSALPVLASASAIPRNSSSTTTAAPVITILPFPPDFTGPKEVVHELALDESNLINMTALTTTEATTGRPSAIDFHACSDFDAATSLFDITEVTVDPNPIKKRTDVHIVTRGTLKRDVGQGATVALIISRGTRRHQLDFDFCKGVSTGCPVEAGEVEWWTGQHISGFVSTY